ncbi:diphthine-ammonia ligase [Pancytospora philotis]|nr:diphthine-ammonia ligase [Pancytospora philotis]
MKFVALVSGGKDSIHSVGRCTDDGHELVALVHMRTTEAYSDSYMYQTVGSEVAALLGECFGCPLFICSTACVSANTQLGYETTPGDEVEDLYAALSGVRAELDFDAVCSGAILSRYQKNRVEDVCRRLGVASLAPLWERNQRELLEEMIAAGLDARIVKIASSELRKECLGMTLPDILAYFDRNPSKYGTNHCGEGGEYETVVFDCCYFKRRIVSKGSAVLAHPEELERDGGVYFLTYSGLTTEAKERLE